MLFRISKLWYIPTMEYYSEVRRSELSKHEKTWWKLKHILVNERSQSERITYTVIPMI